jgi:hypothetical protein
MGHNLSLGKVNTEFSDEGVVLNKENEKIYDGSSTMLIKLVSWYAEALKTKKEVDGLPLK